MRVSGSFGLLLVAGLALPLGGCETGLWSQPSMRVVDAPMPNASGDAQPPQIAAGMIAAAATAAAPGFPDDPSLSPDGAWMVFSWAGDLWSVSSKGGTATRLTSHPAEEGRSAFSPDGRFLAFESDRDGARNLYIMSLTRTDAGLAAGAALRVTSSDRPQSLSGWSNDGRALLFTALVEPTIFRSWHMYRVELPTDLGAAAAASSLGIVGGEVSTLSEALGATPRMASDGSFIVFSERPSPFERPKYRGSGTGELWKLSVADASVTRLTNDPASDFEPSPLPDGSVLYISSRDMQNNVWRTSPTGGNPTQYTNFAPTPEQLTIAHGVRDLCVSRDGTTAAFVVWNRLYRLDLTQPPGQQSVAALDVTVAGDSSASDILRVTGDRDASEYALSPDGKTLAVIARGEVFVRNTGEGFPTRRVTSGAGRERDPAWSPDNRVLYFVTDQSDSAGTTRADGSFDRGRYRLMAASVALSREDISTKPKKDAEKKDDAEAKKDGEKKEPEKKDSDAKPAEGDAAKPKPKDKDKDKKPDFAKRWSEALTFDITVVAEHEQDIRRPIPSPDGRLLLFTRHLGDLVLKNLETGSERVLVQSWNEADAQWASDSRHIVYAIEDLDFNSDIWLMDTGGADAASDFAPTKTNLTQHPDNDTSPRLSSDGKVLMFLSERGEQSDQTDVYAVYLDKELEGMTSYERDDYFKKAGEAAGKRKPIDTPAFALASATPAAPEAGAADKPADKPAEKPADDKPKAKKPEPLKFESADAYLRIRRITTSPGAKGSLALTPGADRIIFSSPGDTESSLVSIDHKGGDRKVLQAGAAGAVDVSLTGEKVLFIRQGVVNSTPKLGGKVDALAIDAPIIVDVAAQQRQKFLEMARTFGDRFYHPTMKGLDWTALTKRYLPLAQGTRTTSAFNQVCNFMFGELEGSHTGAMGGSGGFSAPSPQTGYLGLLTKAVPGGYEVTDLTQGSPADQPTSRINVGDVIVSVDSTKLAPNEASLPTISLDAALQGRAGRETLIGLKRVAKPDAQPTPAPAADAAQPAAAGAADATPPKPYVLLTPLSWGGWDALAYAQETRHRRAEVERLSSGRLGYLHIRAMGEPSVREFERDLFAAASGKEGLIIDVRDNGGGFTADILLSSLTAPRHAKTLPRGADPQSVPPDAYPRDRRLIYAWSRPLSVLINQNSFSNAEIFAHAIRTTNRGRVVGTATFGGVISTGAFTLIDSTTIRMPFRGWYLPDGTDMENNGARPHLDVPLTPADQAAKRDPQLEAAVQDLLKTVGNK